MESLAVRAVALSFEKKEYDSERVSKNRVRILDISYIGVHLWSLKTMERIIAATVTALKPRNGTSWIDVGNHLF